jgi:hypothetical protein
MISIGPFLENFTNLLKGVVMRKWTLILIYAIALMSVASASDIVLYSYETSQSSKIPT